MDEKKQREDETRKLKFVVIFMSLFVVSVIWAWTTDIIVSILWRWYTPSYNQVIRRLS